MNVPTRKCLVCKKEFKVNEESTLNRIVEVQAPTRKDVRNPTYMAQIFYCKDCAKTAPGTAGAG